VSREVVISIDRTERRAAFFMAALGGLLAIVYLYAIIFVGKVTYNYHDKYTPGKACATGYHVNAARTLCVKTQVTTLNELWFEFALFMVASLALFLFARYRRRTGTVFVSLFEGLAVGQFIGFIIGAPFVLLGIWLLIRAWRLNKYGVPTYVGVQQFKRTQAEACADGRPVPTTAAVESPPPVAVIEPDTPRTPAPPSKRYTPKKTPKKR
jgi:hypothetical protein